MSFEDTMKNHGSQLVVGLTIEDDFVLTRLKNRAISLEGKARDQYMWKVIYNFVSDLFHFFFLIKGDISVVKM